MKTCSSCGAQCEDNVAFCTSCGEKIAQPEQNNQQTNSVADNIQAEPVVQSHAQTEPTLVKCEFCGESVPSTEAVCPKCGAQLQYSKQSSIEAATGEFLSDNLKKIKKAGSDGMAKIKTAGTDGMAKIKTAVDSVDKNKTKQLADKYKKFVPIAGAALVLIILLLILVPRMTRVPKFDTYGANALSYYITDSDMVVYNNKKVIAEINDVYNSNPKFNLDMTKAVILADFDGSDGGTLYLVDSKGKKSIDDGVIQYVVSNSGNGIAYFTDYDASEETATLMLFNGKKSIKIEDDIYFDYEESSITISPDGRTVAYVEYDDEDYAAYISVNGKEPKKLGKNQMCIGVSDNAKYVYYIDYDKDDYSGELYVKTGNKKNKLASDARGVNTFLFNKDNSQIFYHYDGKSYISIKGNEKVKILSDRAYPLLPLNTPQTQQSSTILIYGVNSFTDKIIRADEGLYYLDRKLDSNKITDSNYKAAITKDMTKLIYTDYSENLHIVTRLNSNRPKEVELDAAEDVVGFAITEDGKRIYYVNDDEELYSITASNKPRKIADDVYSYSLVTYGSKVFFLADYNDTGSLYYTSGSRKTAVKDADEVAYLYRLGNGLIYHESNYDDRVIYGSTNGSSFNKIYEAD